MALFVSKYNHCLYDILGRYSAGELNVNPFDYINHMDLKSLIQYSVFPCSFTKDNKESGENKSITKSTRSTLLFWPLHANHNTQFNFALRK
jgi:formyltetrahydrofolate deformylase